VTKPTTYVRRKAGKARPPAAYVVEHPGGRFDVGCRSCRVVIAGMVDQDAAEVWARTHRCADTARSDGRPFP
jgi:hypothetical protein